jgi:putative ABC transport system ATP-binding protein
MHVLEARELKKTYQLGVHEVKALNGVNFGVIKGEFVAIMGPSGSGKSTLLHLLGGLDQPSEGEVVISGKPLSNLKDHETTLMRRHNVGFIFQFYNLLPNLTAEENILLPIIIDGKNTIEYSERLDKLLGLIGLAERRDHKPDQLSGGEQQRVSIARALITEPIIVLADEPTGNLDSTSASIIMNLLQKSCKAFSQTIVLVTHDPKAATYADRVVFLRDGEIALNLHYDLHTDQAIRLSKTMNIMQQLETSAL